MVDLKQDERVRVSWSQTVGAGWKAKPDPCRYASGHLVQIVPSLDTPLHFLGTLAFPAHSNMSLTPPAESLCLMLLFWNIADSMWRLNRLSSLPPPTPRSPPRSPTRPSSATFTPPSRGTPTAFVTTPLSRSSPKVRSPLLSLVRTNLRSQTRPSPSPSTPAASPFRSSLRKSPAALSPAPATPLFRRSLLSSSTGSPGKEGEATSSVLSAYMARHSHSPMACELRASEVRTNADSVLCVSQRACIGV